MKQGTPLKGRAQSGDVQQDSTAVLLHGTAEVHILPWNTKANILANKDTDLLCNKSNFKAKGEI